MKRSKRSTKINKRLKVPRLFKIRPELDDIIRAHSEKTNITQTRLVELAIENYFAIKR